MGRRIKTKQEKNDKCKGTCMEEEERQRKRRRRMVNAMDISYEDEEKQRSRRMIVIARGMV